MEIGYEKCEVASLDMEDFVEGKSYRLVVQRSPLKDKDGSRLRNLSPDTPDFTRKVRKTSRISDKATFLTSEMIFKVPK